MKPQFSVRSLLLLMAGVASFVTLWTASPGEYIGVIEIFSLLAVPAFSATVFIESRGYKRACWLGIAISSVVAEILFILRATQPPPHYVFIWKSAWLHADLLIAKEISQQFRFMLSLWLLTPAIGIVCMVARWFAGSRGEAMRNHDA